MIIENIMITEKGKVLLSALTNDYKLNATKIKFYCKEYEEPFLKKFGHLIEWPKKASTEKYLLLLMLENLELWTLDFLVEIENEKIKRKL